HAEEDDVGEGARLDALDELVDMGPLSLDEVDRAEPPKPLRDCRLDGVLAAPGIGAARPEGLDESIVVEL
ncbi:MAG: hypothetical protein DMF87_27900, partial [Acidobacteria bacterium]